MKLQNNNGARNAAPIFKAHPSQLGKLMTNPRTKADSEAGVLSKTAMSVVNEWMKYHLYGIKRSIYTDAIHKGIVTEEAGIELINKFYGYEAVKNEETKENAHFVGTCDIYLPALDLVIDHKSSETEQTFPLLDEVSPIPAYEWQVQAYSDLWQVENVAVIYTLQDHPDDIVEKYAGWEASRKGVELDFELFEKVKKEYTFSNLPDFLRVKRFDFKADPEMIQAAKTRVEQIQKYVEASGFYDLYGKVQGLKNVA